jgi:tape measure domain-containing protein
MPSRKLEYQITGRDFATPAFNSVQASIQRTEARLQGIQTTALRLRTTFAGLTFSGFGAGIALRDAGRLETTLIRLQGISNNFAGDQQFLIDQSRSLGLTISDLAENFQQLAVLEKIELLDPGQARLLTVGFEEAAKAFGTSSTDIQLAVRGIRQALTQEVVRAQEFDQIFDALGAIQPAVARQLGITTKEFQQLRGSGNLLAKDLVDALVPALNEYEGSAARAAKSIDGSFRLIGNAYQNILLAFNEDISDNFQGAASVIAGSLDAISNNSEEVSSALSIATTAILAGFGGRAVGAMANFANQQERAALVSRSHSLALVENEKRNISLVRSQQPVLKSEVDAARARLQSLQSTRAVPGSKHPSRPTRWQWTTDWRNHIAKR